MRSWKNVHAVGMVLIAFRLQSEFGQHLWSEWIYPRQDYGLNRLSASVRIWTSNELLKIYVEKKNHGLNRLSASVRIWTGHLRHVHFLLGRSVLIAFRLQSEFGHSSCKANICKGV